MENKNIKNVNDEKVNRLVHLFEKIWTKVDCWRNYYKKKYKRQRDGRL